MKTAKQNYYNVLLVWQDDAFHDKFCPVSSPRTLRCTLFCGKSKKRTVLYRPFSFCEPKNKYKQAVHDIHRDGIRLAFVW